jgi:phosphomannomutase
MPTHFFFDVDKTLTPSRSLMEAAHQPIFERLCQKADVVAVSGAEESQIKKQIPRSFDGKYFTLAQSGNHALDKKGSVLWKEKLSDAEVTTILAFIEKIKTELNLPVKDENDLIENRGSQISYSLIGHNEDLEKKYAFDPDTALRLSILKQHAADIEALKENGIEVKTGGTTTLDFFRLGKNKGYNIARFIEKYGWKPQDCIYVGDALFPGGNDETVIGIIPTRGVKDHTETFAYLAEILG